MNIISEVTNRVFNYRWGRWNYEQIKLGLRPIYDYKRFRNSPQGLAIMDEIDDEVKNKVMEHVHVVGEKQFDDSDALFLLVASKIDLSDKIIAATAIAHNYIVFTHDGDFLYADADVLTANGKIFHRQR
jgi:predicted nuclease of predicted toxin-antitoxin system